MLLVYWFSLGKMVAPRLNLDRGPQQIERLGGIVQALAAEPRNRSERESQMTRWWLVSSRLSGRPSVSFWSYRVVVLGSKSGSRRSADRTFGWGYPGISWEAMDQGPKRQGWNDHEKKTNVFAGELKKTQHQCVHEEESYLPISYMYFLVVWSKSSCGSRKDTIVTCVQFLWWSKNFVSKKGSFRNSVWPRHPLSVTYFFQWPIFSRGSLGVSRKILLLLLLW